MVGAQWFDLYSAQSCLLHFAWRLYLRHHAQYIFLQINFWMCFLGTSLNISTEVNKVNSLSSRKCWHCEEAKVYAWTCVHQFLLYILKHKRQTNSHCLTKGVSRRGCITNTSCPTAAFLLSGV